MEDSVLVSVGYLAVGLTVVCASLALSGWSIRHFLLNPASLFGAYFALAFLVAPGVNILSETYYWQSSYTTSTMFEGLVGLGLFALFVFGSYRLAGPKEANGEPKNGRLTPLAFRYAMGLSLAGGLVGLVLFARMVLAAGSIQAYMALRNYLASGEGFGLLLLSWWQTIPLIAWAQWVSYKKDGTSRPVLLALCISLTVLAVLIGAPQGSRTRMLFPIISAGILLVGVLAKKGLSKKAMIGLGIGASLVIMAAGFLGMARESVSAGKVVKSETFTGIGMVTEAFREYENLWFLVEHKERTEFENGKTLLAAFTFWVPRALWKDKPLGGGPVMVNAIWPLGYEVGRKDNRSSITPGLPAEAYLNFGLLGIPLLGIVFGLWLAFLGRQIRQSNSTIVLALLAAVSLRSAEFTSMEFYGGLFNLASISMPLVIAVMCRRLWGPYRADVESHSETTSPTILSQGS